MSFLFVPPLHGRVVLFARSSLPLSRIHPHSLLHRPSRSSHRSMSIHSMSTPSIAVSSDTTANMSSAAIPVGRKLSSAQTRSLFIKIFEERGHVVKESASLTPDDKSILFTIAGMVPFKPIFEGSQPPPTPPRAVSAQKCIRTSDIENVGVTKRHHTFFEMLGNFSFGDYFKNQAMLWAYTLLTEVYGIPKQRLAVSVFEEDLEAEKFWIDTVGFDKSRVVRMGAADNFWASGETGPCGPCSEIYYDFKPEDSTSPVDLEDDERFVEVYNLVFMQYYRDAAMNLTPLEKQCIDTGLGLERLAMILQRAESNYETDLILPIIEKAASLVGIKYETSDDKIKKSLKIIGDHSRAIAHLISDGVAPGNEKRMYVTRRLIRRVVRHGQIIGIPRGEDFIGKLLPTINELAKQANLMNIDKILGNIKKIIKAEEDYFSSRLEIGEEKLIQVLQGMEEGGVLPGKVAFEFHDTFGFPKEITMEIAAEKGITVDEQEFEACMREQQERSRGARSSVAPTSSEQERQIREQLDALLASLETPTEFVGYTNYETSAQIKGLVFSSPDDVAVAGDVVRIILDKTPFYAEGGGQVGDTGTIELSTGGVVEIKDTIKEGKHHVHVGVVKEGRVQGGESVRATIDSARRRKIVAHHTATHLLQAALKKVMAQMDIKQAGSLVDADKLRFDFNCNEALTATEISEVEKLVNEWILAGQSTEVQHMSLEEATAGGAVAMFGEKYDADKVRVVDMPGMSKELCGGTHVSNTAEISVFKIVGESGPSAGIRRIEAICGSAVLPYLTACDDAVKKMGSILAAPVEQLPDRLNGMISTNQAQQKTIARLAGELAVQRGKSLVASGVAKGGIKYIVEELKGENIDAEYLKKAAEAANVGDSGVVLLAAKDNENNGKVMLVAAAGKTAIKAGIHAGKLVKTIAQMCGGGGGGRPNIAQAGGKNAEKLDEALDEARRIVREALE